LEISSTSDIGGVNKRKLIKEKWFVGSHVHGALSRVDRCANPERDLAGWIASNTPLTPEFTRYRFERNQQHYKNDYSYCICCV
jgi:hypothetical protein